jgi:NADPH-dependent glutamate synthase beta subunit-like oxidoreductase
LHCGDKYRRVIQETERRSGIFASGDVVLGAKTVVEAVKFSKTVADQMDEYMQQFIKKN